MLRALTLVTLRLPAQVKMNHLLSQTSLQHLPYQLLRNLQLQLLEGLSREQEVPPTIKRTLSGVETILLASWAY